MRNKGLFKFNNGNLAILCANCNVIIKTGIYFTSDELLACQGMKYLKPQYCNKCSHENS